MTPDGNSITCEFRQGGGILPVSFSRVDKLPVLLRPQEPKKPYPYNEEEVVFDNLKAGIKLAGTLTLPKSGGKYAAVILVTGSGQQDRNETIGGHKPFLVIADYLTRNGIAVLRVDDRGTGGSTGNFNTSTTGDFSGDALAGVAYLKTRPEIDPEKIGIIGHSEGGIVSALSASASPDVAFIVSMAGVFVNFEDVVIEQLLNQQKQQGRNDDDLKLEHDWRAKIYGIAKENTDSSTAAKKLWSLYDELTEDEVKRLNWPRGRHDAQIKQVLNPWWRYALALDNKAVLSKVTCPVLAVYGELDQQVNPDKNIAVIEDALKTGNNKDITVKEFPGLNHLFQTAGTGSEYEYIRIEETISPDALKAITDWIKKTTGSANPDYDASLAQKLGADDYGMKSYVLVILKTGNNKTTDKTFINTSFRGHLENINRLVEQGKLIVAGPLGKNDSNYRGIFILNAANIEEAEKLLQTDPAIKEGLLAADLYNWYGSAALPEYLEFSDKIWKVMP
jgi:hypothetical protein